MSDHPDSTRRRRMIVTGMLPAAVDDRPGAESVHGDMMAAEPNDDRFRIACGLTGAVRIAIVGREDAGDEPEAVKLDRPSILIGRAANCDVHLRDPAVSFRHAYLQLLGGRMFCFDLASRSGTFCRSDRHRSGPLAIGEEVFIGPYSLSASILPAGDESGDEPGFGMVQRPPEQFPETVLAFLNGSPRPRPLALNRPVTLIGKDRHCRVTLTDDSVSRVHCSIVRTGTGVWVVDLLGKGGTLVNGRPVQRAPLDDGDELTVGRFRMQVQSAATTRALARGRSTEVGRRGDRGNGAPRPGELSRPPTGLIKGVEAQPAAGSRPAGTFSESFVISLVDQFAAMQQQMFEQSQQTMTAMAEILQSRHESEVDLVREELKHIRSLSTQLQELGQELSERNRAEVRREEVHRAAADIAAAESPPEPQTDQLVPGDASAEPAAESDTPPPQGDIAADAAPQPDTPVAAEAETPVAVQPDAAADPAASAQRSIPDEPVGKVQESDDDAHAWLTERIAAIEKERSSRWKKITRILSGATDDRVRP